jgi:predicted DNA-binding WGR domain protein
MELIQTTRLRYRDRKLDKVYYAELCKLPNNNFWNINYYYGRRGNALNSGIKNEKPLPFLKAKQVYDKLIASKQNKGYNVFYNSSQIFTSRTKLYMSFASELSIEKYMTEEEYTTVTRMLYSNDPEIVKLAEVLIETKEKKRWERI